MHFFLLITAVIFLGLHGTNQNLMFWYQDEQSEDQLLVALGLLSLTFALAWVGSIRISAFGTKLTNQKLSFWYHGTSLTGSHTKPPIMPHFSECPHLPFTYLFAAVFGFLLLGRTPFFSPIAMSVVCISVIIFVFPLFSQMSLIPREKSTKKEL